LPLARALVPVLVLVLVLMPVLVVPDFELEGDAAAASKVSHGERK
jgi:hypothetical protein